MPVGPGKYDDICTAAREKANALCAIVVLLDGDKGHGFSVQTESQIVLRELPSILREVAGEIEASLKAS